MLEAQAGAGITAIPGDLRTFRNGAIVWVADRSRFKLPDGSEVPFRMTTVFHQENGAWKLVQEYASFGVSNEEAIGNALSN